MVQNFLGITLSGQLLHICQRDQFLWKLFLGTLGQARRAPWHGSKLGKIACATPHKIRLVSNSNRIQGIFRQKKANV